MLQDGRDVGLELDKTSDKLQQLSDSFAVLEFEAFSGGGGGGGGGGQGGSATNSNADGTNTGGSATAAAPTASTALSTPLAAARASGKLGVDGVYAGNLDVSFADALRFEAFRPLLEAVVTCKPCWPRSQAAPEARARALQGPRAKAVAMAAGSTGKKLQFGNCRMM